MSIIKIAIETTVPVSTIATIDPCELGWVKELMVLSSIFLTTEISRKRARKGSGIVTPIIMKTNEELLPL